MYIYDNSNIGAKLFISQKKTGSLKDKDAKGVTRQNSEGLFHNFLFIDTNTFLEKKKSSFFSESLSREKS